MQRLLSIIIPSYNRTDLLVDIITKLTHNLKILNFHDYEIVAVNSGVSETNKNVETIFDENVVIYNLPNRMQPGIARNYGIENSSSKWVWFIDDDDDFYFDNISTILKLIEDSKLDLIAHSLKMSYDENTKSERKARII
jgi:glycosyltransferase involved in cell wall biosynthesis